MASQSCWGFFWGFYLPVGGSAHCLTSPTAPGSHPMPPARRAAGRTHCDAEPEPAINARSASRWGGGCWWMKLRGFWSQRNRSHISAEQHTRAAGRRLTARTPVVTYGKSDSFTAVCCRGYSGLARKEETSSSRLLRLLAKATKLSFLSSLSGCAHQMSHVLTKKKPKKTCFFLQTHGRGGTFVVKGSGICGAGPAVQKHLIAVGREGGSEMISNIVNKTSIQE